MENQGEINVPLDEEQKAANEGRITPEQRNTYESLEQENLRKMQGKLNREVGKKALEEGQEEIRRRALEARRKYHESLPIVKEEKKSWWERLLKR